MKWLQDQCLFLGFFSFLEYDKELKNLTKAHYSFFK